MGWYNTGMASKSSVWAGVAARCKNLDEDRLVALQRFVYDLRTVFANGSMRPDAAERVVETLSGAYCAALTGGPWGLLIATLADALDSVEQAGLKEPPELSHRRLRSIVRENIDLLPMEMQHVAVAP